MIPYKLLPYFVKPKNRGTEPGIKLNENELDNLVTYAEKNGFSVHHLNNLLMNGEVREGEMVLRIGWFILDIRRDSSDMNDQNSYYVSAAQGVAGKYAYYNKKEVIRLNDMKPWSEIEEENKQEKLPIDETKEQKSREDYLCNLKSRFLK